MRWLLVYQISSAHARKMPWLWDVGVVEGQAWRDDYVGQKSLSCGVQRKVGAEIAKKTWCYSCVTWRRRIKSTDEMFVLVAGVLMIYTIQINAKFHGVTCSIGRDRARKVNKRVQGE